MMHQWASIGVRNVERAGFTERHTLVESFDYVALPKLLQEGARFDFAFIDGMHLFDYTLLDFFFVDVMLDVGGWVIVRCRLDCSSSLSLSPSLPPPHLSSSHLRTQTCCARRLRDASNRRSRLLHPRQLPTLRVRGLHRPADFAQNEASHVYQASKR